MSDAELKKRIVGVIRSVAPEVDEAELATDRPLREQVDLDSMDWLNVIIGFHKRFRVDIPEADYARLVSLDDIAAYLRGSGVTD
jgi:acyl carrier protein